MVKTSYLILVMAIVLAGCNGGNDTPPPTEIRIVTGEATDVELQRTVHALETQNAALVATSTAFSGAALVSPTMTLTPEVVGQGITVNEGAVILAEPDSDAEEVARLPKNTSLDIIGQTEPDRIGIIFYNVRYENIAGWVASTQITLQTSTSIPVETSTSSIRIVTQTASPTVEGVIVAPTITPSPVPSGFPTPQLFSVVIVEQLFENGRMIWFQPNRQIWVLMGAENDIDPTGGTWRCIDDTFVDGEMERDPALDPPIGTTTKSEFSGAFIMQPVRGFGKIWRTHNDIRERLGWALMPETIYTTRYEYAAGGEAINGKFEPAPGTYRLGSLFQYDLVFAEEQIQAPCSERSGTWYIK